MVDIGDGHHREFSHTPSSKEIHITTSVLSERHIIPDDATKSTMFIDGKGGGKERRKKELLIHFPHSSLLNVAFFVWLCGVMINTVRHGKRLVITMEGVVLVSPVSASQVHLAGPWEPAAGIWAGKKKQTT